VTGDAPPYDRSSWTSVKHTLGCVGVCGVCVWCVGVWCVGVWVCVGVCYRSVLGGRRRRPSQSLPFLSSPLLPFPPPLPSPHAPGPDQSAATRVPFGFAISCCTARVLSARWPLASLDFPNLPYLIETFPDGTVLRLTQSNAIVRHLGREFGLAGKTECVPWRVF
jgi:hypothetical protein